MWFEHKSRSNRVDNSEIKHLIHEVQTLLAHIGCVWLTGVDSGVGLCL
jgi:hypothetical protein